MLLSQFKPKRITRIGQVTTDLLPAYAARLAATHGRFKAQSILFHLDNCGGDFVNCGSRVCRINRDTIIANEREMYGVGHDIDYEVEI